MEHLPFCSAVKAGDFIFLSGTAALKDDDGTGMENFKAQAKAQAAIDVAIRMGTVAGSSFAWLLKNVQFPPQEEDDSDLSVDVTFRGTAHGSSATAKDELTFWAG